MPDNNQLFQDYSLKMTVVNPYGKLPAIFFPALPFFAASFAAYVLVGIIWGTTSLINRHELLPIQNLIGLMIVFLIVENAFSMVFFIDFNNHGFVSRLLLGIMVTFNAGRNSLSFFMILVVCLGYGVVWPTLGKKMYACIALTIVHFICGALYFAVSLLSQDSNSVVVFLLGLPLSISLFAFYIWILVGINHTIQYLESKRQSVKLLMYVRLSNILVGSVVVLVLIFLANAVIGC